MSQVQGLMAQVDQIISEYKMQARREDSAELRERLGRAENLRNLLNNVEKLAQLVDQDSQDSNPSRSDNPGNPSDRPRFPGSTREPRSTS